jgi:RNA polymerase sigma-70 factor, ECF subfamily
MSDIDVLIQRWRDGDEPAAEALYNQCRGTIFGLAYALLDNSGDAEEVTQDVLVYALSHIGRYDPQRARFTTWLHTITVSRCRNKRRRHFLPSVPLFAWLEGGNDEADSALDLEALMVQQDACDEIWLAIHSLSQPLREAILLRHWADYSFHEIAQMVGCPLRTAQSRVRLAHRQLKKLLAASEYAAQATGNYDQASD